MLKNYLIVLSTFFCLLFTACLTGNQTVSGGPKDEKAPQLLNINKIKNKIILSFDENINLVKTNEIITNINPKPEYAAKKKTLTIKLSEINDGKKIIDFKSSIVDLNESNPLVNYVYAENVGEDTFSLSGSVQMAFQEVKTYPNTYALLYFENFILNTNTDIYDYNFNKANDDGKFQLNYIPNYSAAKILTFKDLNNNNYLDTGDYYCLKRSLDSNSLKEVNYLHYFGNNLIRKEQNDSVTKYIYKNINEYRLNQYQPSKEKITADTAYDLTAMDSLVFSKTINLVSGEKLYQLSNTKTKVKLDTHFFKSIEPNSWEVKKVGKDTSIALQNNLGDTLQIFNLTSDIKKSTVIFINTKPEFKNLKGILYNSEYFTKIEINKNLPLNLTNGKYFLILFEDENLNDIFDTPDLKILKPSEIIVHNLKVIDIGIGMDVDIKL